jgi:hypothetical protein
MTPLQAPRCPLCGAANECAVARSGNFDAPCWCSSANFAPAVLAAVPAEAKDKACLCSRCAGADSAGASAAHARR